MEKNEEIRDLFFPQPPGDRRNYDKQMRLGNAAVDNCSSQGLPDFYFFFSLFRSSLLLFPASFFLSLGLSTLPRASPFAPSCSLPPAPPRRREREGGGVVEAATVEEEEAHTETLICFFRYSPYFPPRLPRNDRRSAAFFRSSLSSSVITSLRLPLFLSRNTHPPRPTATLSAFQPLEQQFIFIAMFCPSCSPSIPRPFLSPQPRPRPTLVLEFFLSVLLLRSFAFSFFLSFRTARVARGQ